MFEEVVAVFYGRRPMSGHGVGLLAWLIPLLLFAALVAVAIYAVIRLTAHGPRPGPVGYAPVGGGPFPPRFGPDPAVETVRVRYARGEMSRDEYLRLMADLGGVASAAPAEPPPWPPAGHPPAGPPPAGSPMPPPPEG